MLNWLSRTYALTSAAKICLFRCKSKTACGQRIYSSFILCTRLYSRKMSKDEQVVGIQEVGLITTIGGGGAKLKNPADFV